VAGEPATARSRDRQPSGPRARCRLAGSPGEATRGCSAGDAWKPERVCYYFINDSVTPSFVVDVSAHYAVKQRALACHATQFAPTDAGAVGTRLTSPVFQRLIESRDAHFGAQVGVERAEGLVVRQVMLVPHLLEGGTG
jgi:LmbE family N-acetylglucosaminyl deacetylase